MMMVHKCKQFDKDNACLQATLIRMVYVWLQAGLMRIVNGCPFDEGDA
jgi:hypothetical protein